MISTSTVIITVILAILTIALPRKYFLASYVLAACFVPADQRIIIMDLDFTCLRILIVAGALRIFVRGEQRVIKLNKFDKLLLAWALCGAAIYVLQWRDMRSVIYKCGALFDVIGMYWIFRQSIRSWVDIRLLLRAFAICAILLAPLVMLEKASGKNPCPWYQRPN